MKVILFRPQIPQNTGNIIRSCSAADASLMLVKPLGFSTSCRQMKRAGLDYHHGVTIEEVDALEPYLVGSFYFFSSKATKSYSDVAYTEDSLLIFGSETEGLPDSFHKNYPDHFVTIPMKEGARCLNLSNTAAIALFEARRQLSTFECKQQIHN